MSSNKVLKSSDKIVSAISMARLVDMKMRFVSTNGSDLEQNFMENICKSLHNDGVCVLGIPNIEASRFKH